MNLLHPIKPENGLLTISNFRKKQYDLIPYFCDVMINYVSTQGNNYLKLIGKKMNETPGYFGAYDSQLQELLIETEYEQKRNIFLKMLIPKLVYDDFFYLNGNFYVPTLYIVDYPITIKKSSIMLFGLFNSITIYMKDDIAIFTGVNIPLSMFLQILLSDTAEDFKLAEQLMKKYKRKFKIVKEGDIYSYFGRKFNHSVSSINEIQMFLHKLFFDDYTFNLYKNIYGEDIDLKKIVRKGIEDYLNNNIHNFIDLNHKRVVFIELLFRPMFEKIASTIKQLWYGFMYDELRIDQLAVIKYFRTSPDSSTGRKGLSGNYLYDTVKNLYSGILVHKISMVSPGIENAPKEVQGIHDSHYGRICPITISSQKPGHTVSIVPNTPLDEFGCFL